MVDGLYIYTHQLLNIGLHGLAWWAGKAQASERKLSWIMAPLFQENCWTMLSPGTFTCKIISAWLGVCMRAKSLHSCPTRYDPMDCSPPGSSVHGNSPVKNTGVGCHVLLHWIFLIQGSNSCLLCLMHWQTGSLPLAACLGGYEL